MIDCNPGTSVCPGFLIFKRTGRNQSGAVVRCVASVKLRMRGYESLLCKLHEEDRRSSNDRSVRKFDSVLMTDSKKNAELAKVCVFSFEGMCYHIFVIFLDSSVGRAHDC